MNCFNCKKETINPKFCSRSCSAVYANKIPKRKRKKVCKTCDTLILSKDKYCTACKPININNMTLKEAICEKHHRSSAYAIIRSRARTIGKNSGFKECLKCGYDKHYEVCHIKSISSFPLDTLLSEINHITNLIPLCPNCHWEFDNKLYTISDLNT